MVRQESPTTRRLATAPEEADVAFSSRTTFFPHLSILAILQAPKQLRRGWAGLDWSKGFLIRQSVASLSTLGLRVSGLFQPRSLIRQSSERSHHVANFCDAALAGHRGNARGYRTGRSHLTHGLAAWGSVRRCGRRVFPIVPAPGPGHGVNTVPSFSGLSCGLTPHPSAHPGPNKETAASRTQQVASPSEPVPPLRQQDRHDPGVHIITPRRLEPATANTPAVTVSAAI